MKKSNGFRVLLILVILVIVLAGGLLGTAFLLNSPGKAVASADASFSITKGENLHSLARRLYGERIIHSARFLRLLARALKTETLFKAGTYTIPAGSTTLAIHDLFVEGTQTLVKVTVPEGFTLSRIARLLEEKGLVKADDFKTVCMDRSFLEYFRIPGKSAEGYLFPDTYFFSPAMDARDLADDMITNFYKRLGEIVPGYETMKPADLYDKIIVASIVEREYRVASDAPKIASVFYNRLKINMGLGSCATIEYIITDIEGKPHPEYLKKEDLEIKSNYNTYMWAGLPPWPISNPGLIALKAAFYPEKSSYMYFLLKDPATGEHVFTNSI
ncbi:MAG: endolytic transglycosylase MltG, partial [Spirochaetales bacterium]